MKLAYTILSGMGVLLFVIMLFACGAVIDDIDAYINSLFLDCSDILDHDALVEFKDSVDFAEGIAAIASLIGFGLSLTFLILSIIQLTQSGNRDVNSKLLQLAEMRDKGIISQDEFEAKKREVTL